MGTLRTKKPSFKSRSGKYSTPLLEEMNFFYIYPNTLVSVRIFFKKWDKIIISSNSCLEGILSFNFLIDN